MPEKFNILLRDDHFLAYRAGDPIFAEGDPGDRMYAVRAGQVEIVSDGRVLETIDTGGIFGEMALIESVPRSAAARAKTACEVVPIDAKRFRFLVQQTPHFATQVMKVMADRLRRANRAAKSRSAE
jgi:CRP-like cAMP-binding protein